MKKFYIFLLLVFGLLAMNGCKFKGKNPVDNPVKSMKDLVVSSNFNWKTTKTIPVAIHVPAIHRKQILKIYSIDNQKLLYAGYADTTTGLINTQITIPTSYNMVKLVYGNELIYKPISVGVGNDLEYNYNAFKEAQKTTPCDLSGFTTYTQEGWANSSSGKARTKTPPRELLTKYFKQLFPDGLKIGNPKRNIILTSAKAVYNFLPQGGESLILQKSFKDPTNKDKVAGKWGGFIAAAILNIEYSKAGYLVPVEVRKATRISGDSKLTLGDLVFKDGPFQGMSVNSVLKIANYAIAGSNDTKYSMKDIIQAVYLISENFAKRDLGYFTCKNVFDKCGCNTVLKTLKLRYDKQNAGYVKVVQWQYLLKNGQTTNQNNVIYEEKVYPEETFSFKGNGPDNNMGDGITIYIDGKKDVSTKTTCRRTFYINMTLGSFTIVDGTSKNDLPLCKQLDNICGCDDGLYSLTMRYGGSILAKIKVKEEKSKTAIYKGTLSPGKRFSFTGSGEDGKIGNTIYCYENGKKVTTMKTSCKNNIKVGDKYGIFEVMAGTSANNKPLCHGTPSPGTTTVTQNGMLVYEDLWPYTGDYDFNDLVLSYKFAVTKDQKDYIQTITATFVIDAFGASFHNSFGFQLPHVRPDQVIDATGYQVSPGSIFKLTKNGLEAGQSKATVIVFDDDWRLMKYPGTGVGVNTEMNAPYVQPATVVIHIDFYKDGKFASGGPVKFDRLDIGDYNPFLIVNQQRGVEVHLPDHAPTDLADTKLLGTGDDNSIPGKGRYYKTEKNLPWALNIPLFVQNSTEKIAFLKSTGPSHFISEPFLWPIEKQDITHAYNHFADWAESSGELYPNWYNSGPGYQNRDLLYTKNQ